MDSDDEPAETLPPGTMLGRYQIVRLLGRGGMGAVYEGVHQDLKKRVAIKTLRAALAAQAEARARFLREGEAASRIQHRNVVDVTDVGTTDGITYLVMEFLDGEDLGERLSHAATLSVAETLDIMLPVIAAIAVAHDEGVIHRDLKPENIFLAQLRHSGIEPKVLDFGISKISSRGGNMLTLTGTGASMGTPYYMAPEQISNAAGVDARSDQYALGAILYQCVTGRRAHEGATIFEVIRSVGDGAFQRPRALRPDLPIGLEHAILRAMGLDPTQRFPSVRALGHELLPFASPAAQAQWTAALTPDGAAPEGIASASGCSEPGGTIVFPPAASSQPARLHGAGPASETTFGSSAVEIATGPQRRRAVPLAIGLFVGVGALAGGYLLLTRPAHQMTAESPAGRRRGHAELARPRAPARYHVSIAAHPREASLELDGRGVGFGAFADDLPVDGAEHTMRVSAPGFVPASFTFRDSPPPAQVTLQPVPKPAEEPARSRSSSSTRSRGPTRPHAAHVHREPSPGVKGGEPARKPSGPIRTENNAPIIDD